MNYELGKDFNITTPGPSTTTPRIPTKADGIHIFMLPVNEQYFYDTYFESFMGELNEIAELERCKILNSSALSCHDECFMSDNPDRGCLGVIVGLMNDPLICKITQDEFKVRVEEKVCFYYFNILRRRKNICNIHLKHHLHRLKQLNVI